MENSDNKNNKNNNSNNKDIIETQLMAQIAIQLDGALDGATEQLKQQSAEILNISHNYGTIHIYQQNDPSTRQHKVLQLEQKFLHLKNCSVEKQASAFDSVELKRLEWHYRKKLTLSSDEYLALRKNFTGCDYFNMTMLALLGWLKHIHSQLVGQIAR